jgi:hypothetical protein
VELVTKRVHKDIERTIMVFATTPDIKVLGKERKSAD